MNSQREKYDKKIAKIQAENERRELEEATQPELAEAAFNSMLIESATNSAS